MKLLLFLILLCSIFLLIFDLNFLEPTFNFNDKNTQIKLVFLTSIILFSLCALIFKRKENKQNKIILQKIDTLFNLFSFHKEKVNLEKNLEEFTNLSQDLLKKQQKIQNTNQIYALNLEEVLYQLENLSNAIYFIDYKHSQKLIDAITKTLKNQKTQIKFSLGKTTLHQGQTLQEKLPFYNTSAIIINDDELENFLLENLLSQFGIKSTSFSSFTPEFKTYELVFIKDTLLQKECLEFKNLIIFGKDYREKSANYLSLPLSKNDLKTLLKEFLKDGNEEFKNQECISNVLIFKQNKFENDLFFNIINKSYGKNQLIDSISNLRSVLEETMFRLILLDFETIRYDFENIKFLFNHYKKQYPQAHIIIFSKQKDKELLKECKFISEILDEDISKNDLIVLLKKYLSPYKF